MQPVVNLLLCARTAMMGGPDRVPHRDRHVESPRGLSHVLLPWWTSMPRRGILVAKHTCSGVGENPNRR